MIRQFEKNIFEKIKFTDKLLKKESHYKKNSLENPIFKKQEIIMLFKNLEHDVKYTVGGAYSLKKDYKDYTFEIAFHIKNNAPLVYINVFKKGILIKNGLSHFSYMLNFLPYDENLISKNFGLNTLQDLKNYIIDMYDLFEEFVEEYIKEINAGNIPE